MKKAFLIAAALLVCVAAGAQKKTTSTKSSSQPKATTTQQAAQPKPAAQPAAQPAPAPQPASAAKPAATTKKQFVPAKGDFSFGVTWNPISKFGSYQPKAGDFAGSYVNSLGDYPHQLYILGIDPQFSFQLRYHMSDKWSLRAALGLSGSKIDYKEYVRDDVAYKADTKTLDKVEDCIHASLNGFSLGLEAEYTKSFGPLAFIGGFGLQFAIGGGAMTMDYGNAYSASNTAPSTMPYLKVTTAQFSSLNEYGTDPYKWNEMANGRPLERYNVGYCKALALTCNMGLEYFFIGQMSISATVTFVPVAFYFQPETYTSFEGVTNLAKYVTFDALVSPGSTALLYGTQNIGLRLAFNYYL